MLTESGLMNADQSNKECACEFYIFISNAKYIPYLQEPRPTWSTQTIHYVLCTAGEVKYHPLKSRIRTPFVEQIGVCCSMAPFTPAGLDMADNYNFYPYGQFLLEAYIILGNFLRPHLTDGLQKPAVLSFWWLYYLSLSGTDKFWNKFLLRKLSPQESTHFLKSRIWESCPNLTRMNERHGNLPPRTTEAVSSVTSIPTCVCVAADVTGPQGAIAFDCVAVCVVRQKKETIHFSNHSDDFSTCTTLPARTRKLGSV